MKTVTSDYFTQSQEKFMTNFSQVTIVLDKNSQNHRWIINRETFRACFLSVFYKEKQQ